jgi:GNAT superfamily N-acetyltransferase/chorismate mutase
VSSTDAGHGDLQIRPATEGDVEALASVMVRARRAAAPEMPPPVRPDIDTAPWLRDEMARPGSETWVAEDDGTVLGFALAQPGWLDLLYVAPEHTGAGVGSTLLEVVKHARPHGFALWVFESNRSARDFYRSHGLVELERTDGSGNEERAPDVRMAWLGHDPVSSLRRQVDEVDAVLADVISRRVALTGEIQRHKEVPGHAGRDESREAEIAASMSRRAPVLSPQEWRRIMHEVISVSLDAVERRP